MHIAKVFFIFFLFLSFLSSCTLDNLEDSVYPSFTYNGDGLLFRLKAERFGNVDPTTRALDLTMPFDTLCAYILIQESEKVVTDCEVKILNSVEIVAEGLKTGNYDLLILAVKGNYKEDGATIHEITSGSSPWLSFDESAPAEPLKAEYYYTKHPFSIVDGYTKEQDILIPQAMGLVSFDMQYMSDYVRKSVEDCRFVPSVDSKCYSTLLGNGNYSGNRSIETLSLSKEKQFLFFPTVEGGLSGKVVLNTTNHRKESFEIEYDIQATINAAKLSPIEVQAIHPEDNEGLTIINVNDPTQETYHTILTDDEPASVYTQRSFYIAKPLQVRMVDNNLHLTFYSPVGIKDVLIMAKNTDMNEFVEFAYLDTIPAFADIKMPIQIKGMYRTESGRIESISTEDMNPATLEFKVFSPDPYWAKISQIKAKWKMGFSLYGADPVTGANNGSWWGIRPVHIREAIAIYLNIGYMCTMPEFQKFVVDELRLYDNNRYWMTEEEQARLVPKLENLSGFDVGLVYVQHSGAAGLGGGRTWGVNQDTFIYHYGNGGGRCTYIFHEIGHCMGYNHNSNMTYGGNDSSLGWRKGWANDGADWFYGQNTSKFPVNSHTILNSRSNSNLYK